MRPRATTARRSGQQFDLAGDVGAAGGQLVGSQLVLRRRAAGGGGDQCASEFEAVADADRLGLVGEAGTVQRAEEPVAAAVAGEHAASAVASVGGGGKADHQKAGVGVAERGQGTSPVVLIAVHATLDAGCLLAPVDEAGAFSAGDDLLLDVGDGG